MIRSVTTRYALRSLRRNLRRTLLSVIGVAFGVGIGLIAMSWVRGQQSMLTNAAATGGIGHLRVTPEGWAQSRSRDLRLHDWRASLARIRSADGVRAASPHAQIRGLLGLGTRSAPVTLTGVDPGSEQRTLRYVGRVSEGRYLSADDEGAVVLGHSIVERLRAELGDELVVTTVDDEGELQSILLRIVGVVSTGSRAVDDTIAHVTLADVEGLSGREGAADITILVDDVNAIDATRARVAGLVPRGADLLGWLEVSSDMRAGMAKGDGYMRATLLIILLVVLMGVMSAQLTSVLERKKEFAVLAALGMRGRHLVSVLLVEGLALGLMSGAVALAWSGPLIASMAREGVDLSQAYGTEGVAFGGVLMHMEVHPAFGPWVFAAGFGLSLIATVVASLYPAWFASKTDPAAALRVDR
jgi:ABC-type lipoprotein release transport system permease subunit